MTLPVCELVRVRVRVTALQGHHAFAVVEQAPACHGCGGCGAGVLSAFMTRRARHHIFHNALGARVGDHVQLGMAPAAVLYAALLGYGIPLMTLLLGVAAASWVGAASGAAADAVALLGALTGLPFGMWCGRRLATRYGARRLNPVMLAVVSTATPRGMPVVVFNNADGCTGRQ